MSDNSIHIITLSATFSACLIICMLVIISLSLSFSIHQARIKHTLNSSYYKLLSLINLPGGGGGLQPHTKLNCTKFFFYIFRHENYISDDLSLQSIVLPGFIDEKTMGRLNMARLTSFLKSLLCCCPYKFQVDIMLAHLQILPKCRNVGIADWQSYFTIANGLQSFQQLKVLYRPSSS